MFYLGVVTNSVGGWLFDHNSPNRLILYGLHLLFHFRQTFTSRCHNKNSVPMVPCLFGCHCNHETWWLHNEFDYRRICPPDFVLFPCVCICPASDTSLHAHLHTPQWGYLGLCNSNVPLLTWLITDTGWATQIPMFSAVLCVFQPASSQDH